MGTQACHTWDLAGVSVIGDEGSFQLDRAHLFWVGPIRLRPLWLLRLLQSRKEQTACPVPRTCSPSFRFPRSILSTICRWALSNHQAIPSFVCHTRTSHVRRRVLLLQYSAFNAPRSVLRTKVIYETSRPLTELNGSSRTHCFASTLAF